MDQLTKQFEQARLANTPRPTGKHRVLDENTRADSLIRDLYRCLTIKQERSNSKKIRNLVSASKFEIPLEKDTQDTPPTTTRRPRTKPNKSNSLTITAWKMNEFEYINGTLPTLARGLFTYQDSTQRPTTPTKAVDTNLQEDNGGLYRILIRGYDKFFNVGEVPKTRPAWIESNTEGPFEVTLKENGCIIFMAGLPPHLVGPQGGCVISSKHVLAPNECKEVPAQGDERHAIKGRQWAEKSLATKGKTLQEFGAWLWNNNLTAVAELCDDSFEEHVLQYPAERAGLYLHGLNKNTAGFMTLPSSQVQEVAKEWGFRSTDYETFNSYKEVMNFAEKIRNAGEYDSRPVEGFVVRCKTKEDNNTHFFKVKYDEPYLMYREWREVTKHIWSVEVKKAKSSKTSTAVAAAAAEKDDQVQPMTTRIKYPLTRAYIVFIKDLIQKQPELFAGYSKNQGIIAIREMFLKEWDSKSKKEQDSLLKVTYNNDSTQNEDFQRTVLIPIATIGCGKTTVSVALSKLFGWVHVSSDDFHHVRRNAGTKFIQEVVNQLKDNLVVIADRNNHESLHRQRIMEAVREVYPKTRFVALHWSHDDLPIIRIRELEIERVKHRGNNHQSMTPDYCPEFETIIQMFLKTFTPLNPLIEPDSNFRNVVECKVGESSQVFVERIVKEFAVPTLGAGGIGNNAVPTAKEIEEAVRYAIEDWKPARVTSGEVEKFHKQKQASQASLLESKKAAAIDNAASAPSAKVRKLKEPRYMAIAIDAGSVLRFIDELTGPESTVEDANELKLLREQINAWKMENRIGIHQHVTLVHSSARKDANPNRAQRAEELWRKYTEEITGASRTSTPAASVSGTPVATPLTTAEQEEDGFITVKKSGRAGRATQSSAPARPDKTATVASAEPAAAAISSADGNQDREDLRATATVEYLVWTKRIMALQVSSAKRVKDGTPCDHTQGTLHITVGTASDQVKPVESNEMLRLWKSKSKPGDPPKPETHAIKLRTPKVFSGQLKAMMF
ncbi:hypothetical protein BGX34_006199 [Mortierella sp. NVP85]|nr:hypothetical protein BGX34_006199 [Mortierella sp. NVP85]